MDYKKLASTIAGAALALYGCGDATMPPSGHEFPERDFVCESGATQPCATTADAHTAAERTHEEGSELDNATLTFVVNLLELPDAVDGRAAGFNVDDLDSGEGAVSGTCAEYTPDFVSLTDPDHVGVDNGLVGLVPTINGFITGECAGPDALNCTIRKQIESGSVIMLVEVTGVESLDYDSEVQMQLFRAQVPATGSGTACAADTDCTTAGEACRSGTCQPLPTVGGDGLLAAGQTFEVVEPLGDPVMGDIFEGRVRATTPLLTLMISASGFDLPLMITNPEVRFDITDSGLANGAIGGVLRVQDIVDAAAVIAPGMEGAVRAAVESVADVTPMAATPDKCEALSVGITFGATTATRTGG